MIYVLDTSAWSDALRGGATQRKLSVVPASRILLAAPVLYELRRGAVAAKRAKSLKQAIDDLVFAFEFAPLDAIAADAAASFAHEQAKRGRKIHHLDTLIAGIAIARSATLVTNDKDFLDAPSLATEDWS